MASLIRDVYRFSFFFPIPVPQPILIFIANAFSFFIIKFNNILTVTKKVYCNYK